MKRKINRVGINTLTVSLPSKWAKEKGIKQGDEVEVDEQGNALVISSEPMKSFRKFSMKVDPGNHSYLRAIVGNGYKKGYDEIELTYEGVDLTAEVQEMVDKLLGMEMFEADEKHCILKNVAKGVDTEFDPTLRKSFQLTLQNSQRLLEAVKENNFDNHASFNQTRFMVTRLTDFCKRLLNKYGRNDDSLIFKYLIVHTLEKISNQYSYIGDFGAKEKPKKFSKECIRFFEETNELFETFFHAYYSKDKAKVREVNLKKDKMLRSELYKLRGKLTPDDVIVMHFLATIVRQCVDLSGPFFGITN